MGSGLGSGLVSDCRVESQKGYGGAILIHSAPSVGDVDYISRTC